MIRFLLPSFSLLALLAATPAGAGELRATIANVKPQGGTVMVGLYASPDTYTREERTAGQQLSPTGRTLTAVFTGLPPGRYAVAVYQDADGDGRLSTNLLGVPSEPYGFSNDADATVGKPGFDAVAVTVGDGTTDITITLTP